MNIILTDDRSEVIKAWVKNDCISVEEVKRNFDQIHDKARFKAFWKVTIGNRESHKKQEDPTDECATDEKKAKAILEEQEERAEQEIQEIERMRIDKVGKVWEIKRRVIGGKKRRLWKQRR